jgi:hypothetical protein
MLKIALYMNTYTVFVSTKEGFINFIETEEEVWGLAEEKNK